jgi:hypothetical protein
MGKHRKTPLLKLVDQGKARLVERVVQGVDLGDGNIRWLQDHDEEVMDGHIGVYDERGVIDVRKVEGRASKKFKEFFRKARTVGGVLERLIGLAPLRALLKKKRVNIEGIEEGLEVLNRGSTEQRIRWVISQVPNDDVQDVYELLEAAFADGVITQLEWERILTRAGV